MQIVCPSCATSYDLGPDSLGASGRSVRCARCRNVWFASPTTEPVANEAEKGKPANADPALGRDETWAAEGKPSGEFEWSLERPEEVVGHAEPAAVLPTPEITQNDDVSWSLVENEDVADAEAPSLVPAIEPEAAEGAEDEQAQPDNVETVAVRRSPKKAKRAKGKIKLPRPGMPVLAVALAAMLGGLLFWRSDVVRALPQTASLFRVVGFPVNLRGLAFDAVKTTGEVVDGVPVLIVEGTIANVVNTKVEVPRLRFSLRNRAGQEIYAWTSVSGRNVLAPGETATFRTRLASPPSEGRDVIVRFVTRNDFRTGMR